MRAEIVRTYGPVTYINESYAAVHHARRKVIYRPAHASGTRRRQRQFTRRRARIG